MPSRPSRCCRAFQGRVVARLVARVHCFNAGCADLVRGAVGFSEWNRPGAPDLPVLRRLRRTHSPMPKWRA
ncbi:conserved protein of unknown function [Ectopseudomonas oleovorans]|uniref:Uncharacterized protein n=1 Tax=Ectopseudomonas oleovorans TaxID=301 RepID=A0A653BC87_ECTOL|nr:conserved protein of unknown function [Pseudomonas oleovorans]